MLTIFDSLRDISLLSVTARMLIALLCGGAIGMEREYKRRTAGFRTHILICLGAAMTTLTSQYLFMYMHYYTDLARLGAQVVAGIGFIGAGTIIVTGRQRIKGLTTAAGLWAAAIIGLAIGAGFFEGAIFATVLILLAELVFSKLDYRLQESMPLVNLYIEYSEKQCMEKMLKLYREWNLKIMNMQVTRTTGIEKYNACVLFTLRLHKGIHVDQLVAAIKAIKGIVSIQEL